MHYLALLRGINVGGNNKVEMRKLKEVFISLGFENIITYINTGNVLFTSQHHENLQTRIETSIAQVIGLELPIVLVTLQQLDEIVQHIPQEWQNETEQKTDVIFLRDEINSPEILNLIPLKPKVDTIIYVDHALLWNVQRPNVSKSGLMKIVGKLIYKQMTIRNVNTTRRLVKMMQEMETPSGSTA